MAANMTDLRKHHPQTYFFYRFQGFKEDLEGQLAFFAKRGRNEFKVCLRLFHCYTDYFEGIVDESVSKNQITTQLLIIIIVWLVFILLYSDKTG
jgi:hypothetical protein